MSAHLRFCTAGHVDDGKSTLIGRLLYDTQSLTDDQVTSVARSSGARADGIDLSLFTDGLRAEREQGITIDVAYRYFSTPRRSFILADSPGHEQYTRNMATAASSADAVVLLADARHGLRPQTRRHAQIARQMGVRSMVVVVNKMDLVDYDRSRYDDVVASLGSLLPGVPLPSIPISARLGDNVVTRSGRMPWFSGPTLLEFLESAPAGLDAARAPVRLPVQLVVRHEGDFRGYAGQIASGSIARGDCLTVWPEGRTVHIERVLAGEVDVERAHAPMSVTVTLAEDIDIGRGDVFASTPMHGNRDFRATLVWMDEHAAVPGRLYLLKAGTRTTYAEIDRALALNETAEVNIAVSHAVAYDAYADSRPTGSFILIDPVTCFTAAAGMVVTPVEHRSGHRARISAAQHLARVAREARSDADAVDAVCLALDHVL